MRHLLAGELVKVRTTRTALGFGAAAMLIVLASVLISILAGDPVSVEDKRLTLAFGGGVAIVLLLFGAVGATGEFRHRTLAPSVLIAPDRLRLVLARIAAYALTALAFGIAVAIVNFGVGLPLLGAQPGPDVPGDQLVEQAGGGLLVAALSAALGVGIGTLVRNQVAAVVGILVWLTILESLVTLISDDLGDYTLGTTLDRMGAGAGDSPTFIHATLVMLAWTGAFCAAGALVDRRRDVD